MWSLVPLPWKIGLAAGLIASAGLAYGLWRHAVYNEGYQACLTAQAVAVKEGEKKYEKTSRKVQRLPDDALRRELCRWVRDADLPACLKSLAPFRP